MNNYDYCAGWVLAQAGHKGRVLDYGCGAGETVTLLRDAGCEAYGCDVFFEGNDYSTKVPAQLAGNVIRRMEGDTIPFDDEAFDIVVNNMVMEHVPDLDRVLDEIRRVLKPGGLVLSLFPDRALWIEGHCRIPFLHRFPRGGRARVYYAACLSSLGIGARRDETPLAWSRRICVWLDQWTYYRTRKEIDRAYGSRFGEVWHIEEHWLRTRKGERLALVYRLPLAVQRYLVRRLGALAFVARKPAS
jgi:SAM-dependent methyltransferase